MTTLMINNLPMDKALDRKSMAAVHGGHGTGSAGPSTPTTPTITPIYAQVAPTYLNVGPGALFGTMIPNSAFIGPNTPTPRPKGDGGKALMEEIEGLIYRED